MDLDPRLQPERGGQSPSSRQHPSGPNHGTDTSDSPSTSLDTPNHQQEHQEQLEHQEYHEHQQRQQYQSKDGTDHDASALGATGGDPKKSRACEACRGLKVRCEPDLDDEGAPCKRCRKAKRKCVVTMPTRKRQKKTDSRVSELEKKIDALTASLQARATVPGLGQAPSSSSSSAHHVPAGAPQKQSSSGGLAGIWIGNDSARSWSGADASATSQGIVGSPVQMQAQAQTPAHSQQPQQTHKQAQILRPHHRPTTVFGPPDITAGHGHKRKAAADHHQEEGGSREASPGAGSSNWLTPATAGTGNRTDIIDRGVISLDRAADLFQRYNQHMVRHLPAVVFPPNMSVMELRRSKPYLFLAIMAASSSETPGLQRVLQRELMELFAEKVIIVGEKNMELIQALHIAVIWYWPPEHFEELKFYQLVHISAVMALDIGLGKKSAAKRGMPGFSWRDHPFRRQPQPEPTSLECRRTWLTCHFLAANTAMSLHRPNLIRWSPFMTESLEMLRTAPDAYPSDKYFCHLVWTHRMAEDIGVQLSMDDTDAAVNIMDARTQYTLRGLERDLAKYMAAVPPDMMQPALRMGFCILSLYMHELALHSENNIPSDQIRTPFNADMLQDGMVSSEALSAAHINALSACLTAIDDIFQTFLAMDIYAIRCLPVFTFVRVAYAVVILMKMYFSASSPSSELGKVINKDNMRVAYYLEALLEKFSTTAAEEKCRPAAKFLLVLVMLRTWFLKHGKTGAKQDVQKPPSATSRGGRDSSSSNPSNTPASRETPTPSVPQQAQPQQQQQQPPPPPQQQQQQQQQQQDHPSSHPHSRSANTPLQVLSEVAMGRESNTPRPYYGSLPSGPPPPPNSYYTDPANAPPPPAPQAPQQQQQQQQQQQPTELPRDMSSFPQYQPWMSQAPPQPVEMDMTIGLPAYFDFDESLGGPLDQSGDIYEGAKIVLNDPWLSDMFQGLPDPNSFSFG